MWTPGQSIDNHFKLERILGQGGFGVTFLARDTRQNPPVYCVIKTLKKELPDFQTQQAKFRQEALNLAKCSHPHVVAVQDVICHEGIWGLVMDYIEGDTLSTIIRTHPDEKLSEKNSLQYIDEIGQALECVHDRGLLHRDIKPLNIMVRQDNNKAILIDFGLARDFAFDDSRSMTAMMSEGFAPLEQYDRRGKFGPPTDVYALAATLYCMVTGEAPLFNPKGRKQALDGGKPIDYFMWDKLKALGVSDRVQKAIIWGMALSSEDRPQSMREWREALGLVGRSIPQGVQFESSAHASGATQKEALYQSPSRVILPLSTATSPSINPPSQPVQSNQKNTPLKVVAAIVAIFVAGSFLSKVVFSGSPTTEIVENPSKEAEATIPAPKTPSEGSKPEVTPADPDVPGFSKTVPSQSTIPSCNYFAGKAVNGESVNVDLCSVSQESSGTIAFVYSLASQRMESTANCADGTWTTFYDGQTHRPQSLATEKMLNKVCAIEK